MIVDLNIERLDSISQNCTKTLDACQDEKQSEKHQTQH
jgi:hypothetical protein